jgi:hypothetical protein
MGKIKIYEVLKNGADMDLKKIKELKFEKRVSLNQKC